MRGRTGSARRAGAAITDGRAGHAGLHLHVTGLVGQLTVAQVALILLVPGVEIGMAAVVVLVLASAGRAVDSPVVFERRGDGRS